ncbi:MAG: ROK family protein [Actinomycetota bacterium]
MGGTKIAAGVVAPDGGILKEVRRPTPHQPQRLVEAMAEAILEAKDGFEVGGVCLAVPGLILSQKNTVIFSPNLRAIEGIPLKEEIEPRIGMPLTIENDANAAAWGEFRFGAGSEVDHLVFVTLGTGIGGGVISHGLLMRGAQGSGGELGHVTIDPTGPRCACGNRGCFEALASGTAIGRRAREVAAGNPDTALGRLAASRKILGEDVTALAHEGDRLAIEVLRETGVWLGIALAGFVNIFNPEVVAVGGGVITAGDFLLEPARREVRLRARPPSRDLAVIKEASLGPESGVLGAAALARNPLSGEYVLGS